MTATTLMRESAYTAEEQANIRRNLKEAVGYSDEVWTSGIIDKYEPETHHLTRVPFDGSIYASIDHGLSTKEIDERYERSLPPVWWIAFQSVLAFFRRASR